MINKKVNQTSFYEKLELVCRTSTTQEQLSELAEDANRYILTQVASHKNTDVATLIKLYKMAPYTGKNIVENTITDKALLSLLSQDKDDYVRLKVGDNPNTPVAILKLLSKDESYQVRRSIASNIKTPVEVLKRLSKDKDKEYYSNIRRAVATNPNTTVEILTALSKDKNYEVRSAVASNPNTPLAILTALAEDNDYNVRSTVASNPNTPLDTILHLINDKNSSVRHSVASNPNTPIEILILLSKDKQYGVCWGVAENLNTPVKVLNQLSKHEDDNVRSAVASNPNAPVAILTALAKDEEYEVRSAVASNPNTPIEILILLSKDKQYGVCWGVAENLNTPVKVLNQLSKHEDDNVRSAVASNPNATAKILSLLSKDSDDDVIMNVVNNPNTPVEILKLISKNGDYDKYERNYKDKISEGLSWYTSSCTFSDLSKEQVEERLCDSKDIVRAEISMNPLSSPYVEMLEKYNDAVSFKSFKKHTVEYFNVIKIGGLTLRRTLFNNHVLHILHQFGYTDDEEIESKMITAFSKVPLSTLKKLVFFIVKMWTPIHRYDYFETSMDYYVKDEENVDIIETDSSDMQIYDFMIDSKTPIAIWLLAFIKLYKQDIYREYKKEIESLIETITLTIEYSGYYEVPISEYESYNKWAESTITYSGFFKDKSWIMESFNACMDYEELSSDFLIEALKNGNPKSKEIINFMLSKKEISLDVLSLIFEKAKEYEMENATNKLIAYCNKNNIILALMNKH